MDNGFFGAFQRFVSALDQRRPGLGQHLNLYIVRNTPFFDKLAAEIKVRLAGCGETDLDFLEAQLYQQIKHPLFLADRHRFYQSLVAIA